MKNFWIGFASGVAFVVLAIVALFVFTDDAPSTYPPPHEMVRH